MDILILTEIFRKLPRLLIVGIESETFRCETELADAARCDSRYIFTGSTKYDLDSPQKGSNRAFDVVFGSLHKAKIADAVFIHMAADVMTSESQNSNLFNPNSFLSRWKLAPNVMVLELSGQVHSH